MPATDQTVRQIALALPGVIEGRSYGTPAWHVGKKMMVRLRDDGETLVVKVDFVERDRLLERYPDVFYLTDHYRAYQNVLVRLEAVSTELLRQVMEGAWRMVASTAAIRMIEQTNPPALAGAGNVREKVAGRSRSIILKTAIRNEGFS